MISSVTLRVIMHYVFKLCVARPRVIILSFTMLYNIMVGIVMLSVIELVDVIITRVVMPNVVNVSVILLNGIMSSVIA